MARTRNFRRNNPFLDADPPRHLAAPGPVGSLVPRLPHRSLLHVTRFDIRATLQAFQARDLLAQLSDRALQFRILAQQLQH
jgi:hypothetical protein